jgi:hypothetical protein
MEPLDRRRHRPARHHPASACRDGDIPDHTVISGRSLGSWLPITVVFIAALCKEIADRIVYESWRWHDTPYDVLATMFWPTMLWLGIRIRPLIARAHERIHPHPHEDTDEN